MQRLLLGLVAPCALALSASAQIIVLDGQDLAAIVNGAPGGSVIEIQGNGPFVGTLSWSAKTLTIRAGAGFAPVIEGTSFSVLSLSNANPPTTAILEGLTLRAAPPTPTSTPAAMSFTGTSLQPEDIVVRCTDCVLEGNVSSSGTGMHRFTGAFRDTRVEGTFSLGGTGNLIQNVTIEDCTIDALSATTTGSASVDVDVRRTRVLGRLSASPISSSVIDVFAESTILVGGGPSSGSGISLSGASTGRFVNLTVTGFDTGIAAPAAVTFENMLLFGNGSDVANSVSAGQISNSLISDGTFNGANGNFAATPGVDSLGALVLGSPGLDAGNNAAAGLGTLDLAGQPRIQDSDTNGSVIVNVGAYEALGNTLAQTVLVPGSGVNPIEYVATSPPVLGGTFGATIATNPTTVLTVVAIDLINVPPYVVPFAVGEILVPASVFMVLDVAAGVHAIPVPANPAAVGATLGSQGFRAEILPGPIAELFALNGLGLTLGL